MNRTASLQPNAAALNVRELLGRHGELIRCALLIRRVEETLLRLFSEGQLNGTVHTCIGQELIGPCVMDALIADDFVVSNHRGHGHYIARTNDVQGLIAELMGRTTGAARGIGGSQHLIHHRYLSNGIQGGMTPVAAGVALANQIQQNGQIAVAFIGDGTLGEGILYETLNICAIWKLPILFILENNGYAQSTCMEQTFAGSVANRMQGFGLNYVYANVWDLDDLRSKAARSVELARSQQPCFLEVETYRLKSHSKGDDNRREDEPLEYWRKDLLTQLINTDDPMINGLITDIDAEIAEAVLMALDAPVLDRAPQASVPDAVTTFAACPTEIPENKRISELIYRSFNRAFGQDDTMVMLGEDIEYTTSWTKKPYGGAFKVTRDLSELYQGRVKNTPISEAAIVGVGTGLAVGGMQPVVEIMFGDFLTLAFDQLLNHACKFCDMYGANLPIPLVIRTPMGGRRGYGPTHSQSLERHFLGIPNLWIVALNRRVPPEDVYESIHKHATNPVLVIENKVLYTQTFHANTIAGFEIERSDEQFPTIRVTPQAGMTPDVTIACYGGMLDEVEQALELALDNEDVICEIICPTRIQPMNIEPFLDSVRTSRRLLIIEEGGSVAAWGSEVASRILEAGITLKWFRRVGCDTILPCSLEAEMNSLPTANDIARMLKEVANDR